MLPIFLSVFMLFENNNYCLARQKSMKNKTEYFAGTSPEMHNNVICIFVLSNKLCCWIIYIFSFFLNFLFHSFFCRNQNDIYFKKQERSVHLSFLIRIH